MEISCKKNQSLKIHVFNTAYTVLHMYMLGPVHILMNLPHVGSECHLPHTVSVEIKLILYDIIKMLRGKEEE